MKRILAIMLALILCVSLLPAALADDAAPNVYVTISAAGTIEAAHYPIALTDADEDGALTVNDALILIHEDYDKTYKYEKQSLGLAITELWSIENGGSYGYCVNNVLAMSLLDPLKEGDELYAYTFADLETWSDAFSFFESYSRNTAPGELTLTLKKLAFDENWNTSVVPVEGAKILLDGKDSGCVTDKDGHVTLKFERPGVCTVSASSETETLVPAVCVVTVGFGDVSENAWYAGAVAKAVQSGLMVGYADNTFKPTANMTAAEYLTVLYRMGFALKYYEEKATSGENWKEGALYLADSLALSIADLGAAMTREQMAYFTAAFLRDCAKHAEADFETKTVDAFTDTADSAYAADIDFLHSIGAVAGDGATFRPADNIKRCEVAQMILNLSALVANLG